LWSINKEINICFTGSQCLGLWCLTPLSTIFQLSLQLIFIGGETGENHRPAASRWQTLSHNVISCTPCHERDSNSQLQWC